jgi:tetratricopeptide (TPR) repeat protein
MSFKKNIILFLFSVILPCGVLLSQNSGEIKLRELDSIAFSSLENNASSVLEDANKLLTESLKSKPNFYRINAYTLLGIVNKDRGFYVTSLDFYLKALNTAEKLKDFPRQSACLNNIGSVYQLQGNYSQAIEYFNKSLAIEEKLNQPIQKSIRFYNIGECYKDLDSLDLALTYFNNSLLIEQKAKSNEGIVYAYLGIADVYIRIKRFTDASIVIASIEKKIQQGQIEEAIILHKLKGKLLISSGNSSSALSEFQEGENLSLKYKNSTNLLALVKLQIEVYEKSSDWQKAALKYKQYLSLIEKMNSLNIQNQLDDLNYRNEITKKQLEIQLVQEERDLAKKNEKFEKNLRVYGLKITWFVITLLILSIGLILYGVKKLTTSKE